MGNIHIKDFIAKRAARELRDGDVVCLGIGLPTFVTKYIPDGVSVVLQSDNGVIGTGTLTDENADPFYIIDAGGLPSAISVGGAFMDSASSFGLIRGGHTDVTILGGLEVDEEGSLASWIIPGKMVAGMGGAMDLLVGARKVIITMDHTAKGNAKILKKCRLPLTAVRCVNTVITERCVMEVTAKGLVMTEINPEFTVDDIRKSTEADFTCASPLKYMGE